MSCSEIDLAPLLHTDEAYQHGQVVEHISLSPHLNERLVFQNPDLACARGAASWPFQCVFVCGRCVPADSGPSLFVTKLPIPHCSCPPPAGACGHPKGSPGAVCRGWTLSRSQLTSFSACGPEAHALEVPGNGPGHAPATALSVTDLL